jgi:hypothetical protein
MKYNSGTPCEWYNGIETCSSDYNINNVKKCIVHCRLK